jgi:TRAP transporter 4TM/12TM fusion protein
LSWSSYSTFVRPAALLAIGWSLFQLHAAAFGQPAAMLFRPMHVVFAVALVFAVTPASKRFLTRAQVDAGEEGRPAPLWSRGLDVVATLAALAVGLYYILNATRISERVTFIDEVLFSDIVVGLVVVLLVLEACRRVIGPSLPLLALIFLAYQLWGEHLQGVLRHRGITLERFIDLQLLSPQGLFGVPVGVSAEYVFYFILFAAFLEVSGGGKLFIDLAFILTGRARGGPAKASIVGSALMGSINGSAVANVVSTGVFTIPLMKRTGYKPTFAAAVEAMASTGGQILPPIMGAGAFIMAQMLGRPYQEIILAAALPAVLYFAAGYFMVDLTARQEKIAPLDESDRVAFTTVLDRVHLLLPLAYLVYMILTGRSLMSAAYYAIIAVVVVSFLRRQTWLTLPMVLSALQSGAVRAVNVALPTAVAGIIVGVIIQTNLGLQFTELVLGISGGNVAAALVLVMFASIVLGLGMPTTSAYIMAAVLLVPALTELGVQPIAAHLFVFYFACMSMLTPPVALAAYAAAGVADSPLGRTGWTAFRISLAAYLIPYAFVASPALLLQNGIGPGLWFFTTGLLGAYALACGVIGYGRDHARVWERCAFIAIAVALIFPGLPTTLAAAAGLLFLLVHQSRRAKAAAAGPVDEPTFVPVDSGGAKDRVGTSRDERSGAE